MYRRLQPLRSRVDANLKRCLSTVTAKRVVLSHRPPPNSPVTLDNFQSDTVQLHDTDDDSALLVQTLYLSTDPYMRCRFNDDTGVDYVEPFQPGSPITSAGIGAVLRDNETLGFKEGDLVMDGFDGWPWQDKVLIEDQVQLDNLRKLPPAMALLCPVTFALGCVGQTGVSAYFGILGEVDPGPEDVVVVSGAAGAVGSIAGQLAKSRGSKVVGICGSEEKGRVLVQELGFDASVNYKSSSFEQDLRAVVEPLGGISVYFDNVGGTVTDDVITNMRENAHIVLCGQIATYDTDVPYPPPLPAASQAIVDAHGITRQRYLVFNYESRFNEAIKDLLTLVAGGDLKGLETYKQGIESTPAAFVEMMKGGNIGKQLVQVHPPPSPIPQYNTIREVLPSFVKRWAASRVDM